MKKSQPTRQTPNPVRKPAPRLTDVYERLGFVLERTGNLEDRLARPTIGLTLPVHSQELTLVAATVYVLLQDALYVDDLFGLAQFADKLAVLADENAKSEMFARDHWLRVAQTAGVLRDELLALPDAHHAEEDQLLAEVKPETKRRAR